MYEKEDAEARKCPICGAPLIQEEREIKGTDWKVKIWVCSEQNKSSCL